ncbi:hypothetical protein G6F68_019802 [Rhizopus microsporus]|nr:hypothetical protein G6F68_019802 [Rhizopus microsporus]
MASGLPVIGLDAEGVRDLVDHEVTGLLLDMNKKDHYRHLLERLIIEKETRQNMSKEAVKKARKYTWYEAMDRTVQVYEHAVNLPEAIIRDEQISLLSSKVVYDSGVEEDFVDQAMTKK